MKSSKVSLILTTYNCKENLIQTLRSIDEQDYQNIEIIIKDGKSTDGTVEIIMDYAKKHSNVIWKSEKDNGIYDAMNQGYQMSSGDIIAFFNDKFSKNTAVSQYVKAIEQSGEQCMGVHSDLVYAENNKVIRYWKMGQGTIQNGWMPGHPTLYLKREVYEKYGLYNPNYKCSADYEFMVRILSDKTIELAYIPEVLISMYYGGTSTEHASSYVLSIMEAHRALRENGVLLAWWAIGLRTIRVIKQFYIGKKYM